MSHKRIAPRLIPAVVFVFTICVTGAFWDSRSEPRSDVKPPSMGCDPSVSPSPAEASAAFGQLPLYFEANAGQVDQRVQFHARLKNSTLFLTHDEAVLVLRGLQPANSVVRMKMIGSSGAARVSPEGELPSLVNYFIGSDPRKWRTNIPTYTQIKYESVYPGIDLVWHGSSGLLEYDFVVHPAADPQKIELQFEGVDGMQLDAAGELLLQMGTETIRQTKPVVYQEKDGQRQLITGRYRLFADARRIRFEVGDYDRSRTLVIDPVLSYSTYLGGTDSDALFGVAVDKCGNAYMTGITHSTDFPTTQGAVQPSHSGGGDVVVSKLSANGAFLYFSTYLGGPEKDSGYGISIDSAFNVYVTGSASSGFPTTPGVFQPNFGGTGSDAFVTKLNQTGTALIYSTYLGGPEQDHGADLTVDAAGGVYVAGETWGSGFPTTVNPFQKVYGGGAMDAFVTKISPNAAYLVYSSYLGGNEQDSAGEIAINDMHEVFIIGDTQSSNFPTTPGVLQPARANLADAFVTKVNFAGTALAYSTYLGGSGTEEGTGIAVLQNEAFVTGWTRSENFPTTPGVVQPSYPGAHVTGFVSRLNSTATSLVYSTFLGGTLVDYPNSIAVDPTGIAHVAGMTSSQDFPVTSNALQSSIGGWQDAFLTRLDSSASTFQFSTYLGAHGDDAGYGNAVGPFNESYMVGSTTSGMFPTSPWAVQPVYPGGHSTGFAARIGSAAVLSGTLIGTGVLSHQGGSGQLEMQVQSVGGRPNGHLNYRGSGLTVNLNSFSSFVIADNTAMATGSGMCNGSSCTVDVSVFLPHRACGPPFVSISVRTRQPLLAAGNITSGEIVIRAQP